MIFSALFIFGALVEMPVWAKVVDSFSECSNFFYKGTEPQGMDQNAIKICQEYEYGGFFYASLYSKHHKIPVYSAYTFDQSCRNQDQRKSSNWFIEPQLSGFSEDKMQPENTYDRDTLKRDQSLNSDYSNTGYDRGHLNPNSYQCNDGRKATFTLTNSAPMDACFNRVHWKQWENEVKAIFMTWALRGTTYLVTGTVPSDYRIPRKGEFDDPNAREYNRVTVPTKVWTAVCYVDDENDERSFSFGYIGLNQPDSRINVMQIPQLNNRLAEYYTSSNLNIFKDDCFSTKKKSEELVKRLYRNIQLPLSDRLIMSVDILNTIHTATSRFDEGGQRPSKKPKVTELSIQESFDSVDIWFKTTEQMKYVSGATCVLSKPIIGLNTGIHKRDTFDNSQEITCNLVPEKVSDCTTSCLYKEQAGDYYCYNGDEEKLCSPEYSIITVSGTKCNSDHTCGKHGENDYWCRVGNSRDYCSTPLPKGKGVGTYFGDGKYCRSNHNCGWYGKSYTWCYTDYSDNWDYCCRIADNRYSALNGKICKPEHPCGYYDKNYLWCKTTDGHWDYCCY